MPHFIQNGCDPYILLNCLTESIHQGISVVDKDLNLVLLSKTARLLLDLPEQLIKDGPTLENMLRFNAMRGDYGPGDPQQLVRERLELAATFVAHDFVRERPDGTMVRVRGTPMENGGFVTIYTDVTQQMAQEAELTSARATLEKSLSERTRELHWNRDILSNAINTIADGFAISSKEGRLVLINDKMREIYPQVGKLIEQGATVTDVIRTVFPDEPQREPHELVDSEVMWTERQFPDGKWYKVNRTLTSDGGILSVYSDVTFYKKQQATLQDHTNELVKHLQQEKKLSEMQREFVSMASHEFRTPLAIIDSSAQRLKRRVDRLDPDQVIERVDKIRGAVDRMQFLINRFLSFSQSQSVGMELEFAQTPLRQVVAAVCERQQSISKHHVFHLDLENLPDEAEVDRKLFEQCISNLLSNAVKYSPGKRDIQIVGTEDDGTAVLSVRDEGLGIPKDELPKVFNRYFRASTSSGIAGTGIGLNMTEMIVRKHRGRVELESELGVGTCITLRLPISQKKQKAPARQLKSA